MMMSATEATISFFSTLLERCHITLITIIIELLPPKAMLRALMLHKTKIPSALFKWSPAILDVLQLTSKIEQSLVIFNIAQQRTNSKLDSLQ